MKGVSGVRLFAEVMYSTLPPMKAVTGRRGWFEPEVLCTTSGCHRHESHLSPVRRYREPGTRPESIKAGTCFLPAVDGLSVFLASRHLKVAGGICFPQFDPVWWCLISNVDQIRLSCPIIIILTIRSKSVPASGVSEITTPT